MLTVDARFEDRYVCVLGLGYVGLTLAATMADVGFKVLGVEIRDDVLAKLRRGVPHFYEPGLDRLLDRFVRERRIKFVKHIPDRSRATVFVITVGTPLAANGAVNLDMVKSVAREVARHLKDGDLVIMRSTVKIGTSRNVVLPILESAGVRFELAFCPERTLEGKALDELRHLPQIVGGATFQAAVRAAQVFQFLTPTVLRVTDLETAEMIKLIDNASRDVGFAYANEVARICDAVGVSAAEVVRAGKLGYPRTNVPMPGPVGGPCLIKDPHILAEGVRELGYDPKLTITARLQNESQPYEIAAYVSSRLRRERRFPKRPRIALLGIAFKGRPATDDLRGTMARPFLDALKRHFPGASFVGYDPVVAPKEIKNFGLVPVRDARSAFRKASLAMILNNHPVLADLPLSRLGGLMTPPALIYDCWNFYTDSVLRLPEGVGYTAIGSHGKRSHSASAPARRRRRA